MLGLAWCMTDRCIAEASLAALQAPSLRRPLAQRLSATAEGSWPSALCLTHLGQWRKALRASAFASMWGL
jgi:hypothetical protein